MSVKLMMSEESDRWGRGVRGGGGDLSVQVHLSSYTRHLSLRLRRFFERVLLMECCLYC